MPRSWQGWLLLASASAQITVDPLTGIVTPGFASEQQFHEEAARSRYRISEMDYVDGAALLTHNVTIT